MENGETLDLWWGSGVDVTEILGLTYDTFKHYSRKFKIPGRRGHRRFNQRDVLKFRLIGLLYDRHFAADAIRRFLRTGLPRILAKLETFPDLPVFYVLTADDETGGFLAYEFSADRLPAVHEILNRIAPDVVVALLDVRELIWDIDQRITAHLAGVPYITAGAKFAEALSRIGAQPVTQ